MAMLCVSFGGCAKRAGGYVLQAIPDALTINPAELSGDAKNLLNMDETYPLLAALPEEDLYVYTIDPMLASGALVKYDGVIRYFSWQFVPPKAEPELYVYDYNGDGKKDVAISFLTSVGQTNHNEELHVLMRKGNDFEDCMYLKTKAVEDVKSHVTIMQKDDGQYSIYVEGKENPVRLNGKGDLLGLYFDDVQDYTLGKTITLRYAPGIVFSEMQLPMTGVFEYTADVVFQPDTCGQANGRVTMQ